MTFSCEAFLDYAYEGEVKIPLTVRIQNTITKLIEVIKKFMLKVRSLNGERVVPKKALDAYRVLSKECFNCINHCKKAIQTGFPVSEIFREPFESPEYKILFSEDIKNRTSPGDYVKIQTSEVLGFMNGALTALSNAKQGLRVVNKNDNPNRAQAFTQIINYSKFMMKISNRVLSYKNMYVEKRHLPTTKVDETKAVNEAYNEYEKECEVALELFGLFKKKDKVESTSEAKRLEMDIRKKVCEHLIKYSKTSNFLQEYRKAIASFPSIEIKVVQNGVQISKCKEGILDPKNWPKHIKDEYYALGRKKDTIFDKYYEALNSKWYQELLQEGKDWCRKNCKVPDNFILQLWDDNGTENVLYIEVFEKIGYKASESFDQIAEEGIFDLFKKKDKKSTPTNTTKPVVQKRPSPEAEKYKSVVSKKTVDYLKKYVKSHKFDQKYKYSFFSYPTMNIEVDEDYGVRISFAQDGMLYLYSELDPKDRAYIKNNYANMNEGDLEKAHPEFFDNSWYYELQDAGVKYAESLSTNKFDIQADHGDGDEGLVYIDVYDKVSHTTESFDQIAEEGIFSNIFQEKTNTTWTEEEEKECDRLEKDVKNKVVSFLKAYAKKNGYNTKYRNVLDIKILQNGYIQIVNTKPGEIEEKWLYKMIDVGCKFCHEKCKLPEPWVINGANGVDDGQETGIYLEVTKK